MMLVCHSWLIPEKGLKSTDLQIRNPEIVPFCNIYQSFAFPTRKFKKVKPEIYKQHSSTFFNLNYQLKILIPYYDQFIRCIHLNLSCKDNEKKKTTSLTICLKIHSDLINNFENTGLILPPLHELCVLDFS